MNTATNPYPYIFAAYALASTLIFGYAYLMIRDRKRLETYIKKAKDN